MNWREEGFDQTFLSEIKAKLLEERQHLVRQNRATLQDMMEQERVRGDSLDESTQEQTTSTQLRFRDREAILLHKIDQALERIADDSYGECDSCGEWINPKRLLARPTASFCIDCKEEQEREEKRYSYRPSALEE